jgi:DNA-binding NarL/FixJ family response regulator
MTKTVVLVDQHPLWLEAVDPIVTGLGIAVVGKTSSSAEGLRLVESHRPDVLITGITMPTGEMSGIELIAAALAAVPSLKALVLTRHGDVRLIDEALNAGAVAYVIKTALPEDLRSAIRQAFSHSIYLPTSQPEPARPRPARPAAAPASDVGLTRRELEILQLVAEGHSNSHLARTLWVTEQTVKFHLSNIYRKLDVANRTEASRWATVNGLLDDRPDNRTSAA